MSQILVCFFIAITTDETCLVWRAVGLQMNFSTHNHAHYGQNSKDMHKIKDSE